MINKRGIESTVYRALESLASQRDDWMHASRPFVPAEAVGECERLQLAAPGAMMNYHIATQAIRETLMQITDILAQLGGLQSMARELGVSEAEAASGADALAPAILGG
ncbi:MAG: hypothetical protein ABIP90_01280, partial [Vicinamibacterales bacterium]